jgi:hypothetical protein
MLRNIERPMSREPLPQPQITAQNRPAQHRRAVYLCADDRYAPFALFLAHQIAAAHPSRDFDICIVSDTPITPHPLHDALGLRLVQIDTSELTTLVLVGARIGFATYLRVFMPQLWAQDYDQLLYLDGDIFYQRGDISALLRQNLGGAPVAAVLDTKQWHKPNRPAGDVAAFGLPAAPYFNAGVLLIDVARFNDLRIGARILDLLVARGQDLVWHDQTALNAVVQGNWAQMPLQWNFQYSHKTMFWAGFVDVCFFHFIGRRKPFLRRYGGFPERFVSPYRQFLAAHFPPLDAQVQSRPAAPLRWLSGALIAVLNLTMLRGALRMRAQSGGDLEFRAPKVKNPPQ